MDGQRKFVSKISMERCNIIEIMSDDTENVPPIIKNDGAVAKGVIKKKRMQ